METILKSGDYVLATKNQDGDPCAQFCIGILGEIYQPFASYDDCYMVHDGCGKNFRSNGFRRAEKITAKEGQQLLKIFQVIDNVQGPSLWWHLGKMRGERNPKDPCMFQAY